MTLGGSGAVLIFASLMMFAGVLQAKIEDQTSLAESWSGYVVVLALLATGVMQSVAEMKLKDVFSAFNLHNPYDLGIRCTWLMSWLIVSVLDFVSTGGQWNLSKFLKSLIKNIGIIVPFVLLSSLSQLVHVENPWYQRFHLDRVEKMR